MGDKDLNILLTNDDGYRAKGITTLADYLEGMAEGIADVRIVAPRGERSGVSHSRSLKDRPAFEPRRYRGRELYVTDGTPADCVFYALNGLYKDEIDIVVSGINRGRNLATDCVISGTVSAAREAAWPWYDTIGLAVSADYEKGNEADYGLAAEFCAEFVKWLERSLSDPGRKEFLRGFYFNLNTPPCQPEDIKGLALTPLASDSGVTVECEAITEEDGTVRFKSTWKRGPAEDFGSDHWAIANNYLSLSILQPPHLVDLPSCYASRQKRLEALLLEEFSFRSYSLERFWQNT